jgi:hypothetical protein
MTADINQRPRRRKEPAIPGRGDGLIDRTSRQDRDKGSQRPHFAIV